MEPLERVAMLLTLLRRLEDVMARENEAVRRMRLEPLAGLHAEKEALAGAYERQLRELRCRPELVGALPIEARRELETGMRRFQCASRRNAEVLAAARTVIDKLMRRLADGLGQSRAPAARYGGGGAPGGRLVALAVDRTA